MYQHVPIPNVNHTQTSLHSNTDKNTLNLFWSYFLKRLWLCLKKVFIVVASAAMDDWAAILAVCRRFGNRRFHYARLRFVSPQEHLFLHCFGTFAISSFPFHFVLRENNFNTASRKMTNAHILQQKYRLCFELPDNSAPRIQKVQYRNQSYSIERLWDIRMRHQNPRTGYIPDWKTNEQQKHT